MPFPHTGVLFPLEFPLVFSLVFSLVLLSLAFWLFWLFSLVFTPPPESSEQAEKTNAPKRSPPTVKKSHKGRSNSEV